MLLQVVFGVVFPSEDVRSAVSIFSNFSLPYLLILLYFDWMLIVLKVKSPPIIFFTFCLLMFLKDFWIRLLWSCTSYKMQSMYEVNLPLSQTGHEQARSSTGQAVALARAFPTPSFRLRCPVPWEWKSTWLVYSKLNATSQHRCAFDSSPALRSVDPRQQCKVAQSLSKY